MYQDAGYGDNWEPEGNNARRLDPYTRSCTILISLTAIGFVLIVIIVLSLIPIYISNKPQQTSNVIQTTKITITNYYLQLQVSPEIFDRNLLLSDLTNRLALQAALTAILQKDSITMGSIVDIISTSIGRKSSSSSFTRRQTSTLQTITFNLTVTYQKICTASCTQQYQSHVGDLLSNTNRTTSSVRYQKSNSTPIYWFNYQLPTTITSDTSIVAVDPKNIESILNTLLTFDNTQNQPQINNTTSMPVG